jgi:hypothetical protein
MEAFVPIVPEAIGLRALDPPSTWAFGGLVDSVMGREAPL